MGQNGFAGIGWRHGHGRRGGPHPAVLIGRISVPSASFLSARSRSIDRACRMWALQRRGAAKRPIPRGGGPMAPRRGVNERCQPNDLDGPHHCMIPVFGHVPGFGGDLATKTLPLLQRRGSGRARPAMSLADPIRHTASMVGWIAEGVTISSAAPIACAVRSPWQVTQGPR